MKNKRFNQNGLLLLLASLLSAALLPGCAGGAAENVAAQEVLLETDFSEVSGWPEMVDVQTGRAIQYTNDGYELSSATAEYVWSFSEGSYEDVVLETAVQQLSPEPNNAYGLVCRASSSESRTGYYFLISGDGLISIRRVERGISSPIVDWTPHNAVHQGQRSNQLRAICAGEYLALYVNGQLVAEGMDGRFTKGAVGFAASGSEDGSVQVTFSNLIIRAAEIAR